MFGPGSGLLILWRKWGQKNGQSFLSNKVWYCWITQLGIDHSPFYQLTTLESKDLELPKCERIKQMNISSKLEESKLRSPYSHLKLYIYYGAYSIRNALGHQMEDLLTNASQRTFLNDAIHTWNKAPLHLNNAILSPVPNWQSNHLCWLYLCE